MSAPLKIVLFVGSVRENRLGNRVIAFVKNVLKERKQLAVNVFDPESMDFSVLRKPIHFYQDQSEAPGWLQEAAKEVGEADGYLIITPEYNATIPPALSNMMDHFPPKSYAYKPTGIITYSPSTFGGIRCNVALRPFLAELGSIAVPSAMTIPAIRDTLDENGVPTPEHAERTIANLNKLLTNLEWYTEATRNQRNAKGIP